jgi:hypothetical protein
MTEHIISDLSTAEPSEALSSTPVPGRWLILPYEGAEVSGKMLWCPARCKPQDVAIPLPRMGLCRIYVGVYGSGTVPIWYNLYGPKEGTKTWCRVHLRLSDEDWFDLIVPENYPEVPRLTYISETLWNTADVSGKSLILAPARKEAYYDMAACVAYARLVPVASKEAWPRETKRLVAYFDSNFCAHYVDSVPDIKSHIEPLRDSDFDTLLWTTCREDTCYYPTKIGNRFAWNGTLGVYPYWAGRDMQRMLDRGEDPLAAVCDVAHDCGLKVLASYRRMTCRMPPFVFPLHPEAFFLKRRDLWCADERGEPVPHLSLTYPEVRQRMIDLLVEQAEDYDIDGVHLFFSRGVPFVYFEKPFLAAFQAEFGADPRGLPIDDERICRVRSRFVTQCLRELRTALNAVGRRRGRKFVIAISVMNSLRICAYYSLDVQAMVRERLVDMILPERGHYFPEVLGERDCTVEFLSEFVKAAEGSGIQVRPTCKGRFSDEGTTVAQRAAGFYEARADGLVVGTDAGVKSAWDVQRRLGHLDQLGGLDDLPKQVARLVKIRKVADMTFDLETGLATCG